MGRLTASGKGLTTKSELSTGSETLTLQLKARKPGRLATTTKVKVVFKPKIGKKRTKTLAVKFNAASRGAAGQGAVGKAAH